jgi:hypothetical protein
MIDRYWGCKNCRNVFQSYEANPPCPECGCVRVEWVPGKLNIGNSSGVDKEVKTLAEVYGMADINTPSVSRSPRAAPVVNQPASCGHVHHWGGGFTSVVPPNLERSFCAPCPTSVTGKVTVGNALSRSKSIDGPQAHTRIEARHIGAAK